MGRPINKKYLGDQEDRIKVSHYRRASGSEQTGGDDTYIVSQKSSDKFLVADTSSDWTEILRLVDKDAGELEPGEFRISANTSEGSTTNVTRLYNRTLRVSGPSKVTWDITTPETIDITGISQDDPAVVSVASTSELYTGDTITISDVVGMTEVNDREFTITLINGTSFSLDDEDSTEHTEYTSGGVVTGAGDSASIDVQDA